MFHDVSKVTFCYRLAGLILGLAACPLNRVYGAEFPRAIKVSKVQVDQAVVNLIEQPPDQPVELTQALPNDSQQAPPSLPQDLLPPSLEALPSVEPPLPSPNELLQSPEVESISPAPPTDTVDRGICVRKFVVIGSNVFTPEELSQVAAAAAFSPETPPLFTFSFVTGSGLCPFLRSTIAGPICRHTVLCGEELYHVRGIYP